MKQFICIIALIFLLCNTGLTQTLPNWQFINISDFRGGLNTRDGAGGIADNEVQTSINCYLLANGVAKRKGFTDYNDSARVVVDEQGTGIFYAPFISAGARLLLLPVIP